MTRQELHQLVDELPEASIEAAGHWLERAKDPMIALLDAAPEDDEPFGPDERATSLVRARPLPPRPHVPSAGA